MVTWRKERTGTWSQSKMATYAPRVSERAWFRLPAFACALPSRTM